MSKGRFSIAAEDVELHEVSVFTCPNCKHPTFDYRIPETVDEAICINCCELINIRHSRV